MAYKVMPMDWIQKIHAVTSMTSADLPQDAIEDMGLVQIADNDVVKRVPDYLNATGSDLQYLEMASIFRACYHITRNPMFGNKMFVSVKTMDISWTKGRVEVDAAASKFEQQYEEMLAQIEDVEVLLPEYVSVNIFSIAENEGDPIGGDG